MAAMGIDLWVPQAAPCQQYSPSIWRDQVAPEIALQPVSEIILKNIPQIDSQSVQTKQVNEVPVEPQHDVVPVTKQQEEQRPILQIAAFSLEAICLEHCVVVIDSTELTADQQLLWANIQRAVSSQFYTLQWPFAWVNLQDGRGAASYVQGFIDAISLDKNILCLGDIPHLAHSKIYPLASLQQMIDQPKLKKRLWQFMQNKMI